MAIESVIILRSFGGYAVGSIQQIDDSVIAQHPGSTVLLVATGGGGTSTGGTSTGGTTSGGGTTTPAGGGGSTTGTTTAGVVIGTSGNTVTFTQNGVTYQTAAPLTAGQVTSLLAGADIGSATVGGVLESVIGSMVATHTAHLLTLDTGLTSIQKAATDAAALASTAGTAATGAKTEADSISVTVTAHDLLLGTHTAQLGTLAAGVTSAGSLAAAASTLAGSALGTPSIVNGALSFKTAAGAAGPVVPLPLGATPTISIGGVSTGATAAANITGSAAAPVLNLVIPQGTPGATPAISIGTVSSGPTAAVSITGSAVTPVLNLVLPQGIPGSPGATPAIAIGTVSSGPSATATFTGSATAPVLNLMLQKGDPGSQGGQGIAGATGSAAGGDVTTNLANSAIGGKSLPLSSILRLRLDSEYFGSQHNNTSIQGYTGATTRAALAAYINASGATPYAFFSNYPVSTGDDVEVYPVAAAASGNTIQLCRSVTLPAAATGYTGPTGLYQGTRTGRWFLYVGGTPGLDWQPGMYAVFPGLASNTRVLATYNNCIMVTPQPAGTTCAAGVVGTIGANMSALKTGQQVWAAQGVQPFSLISTITATGVILSKALDTTSKTSYAVAVAGVFQLQTLRIFTPMAEASICSTMTMDSLAAPAAYNNQRLDDASRECAYLSRGDHFINVPVYLWGHGGGLRGAGVQDTFIRTECSAFAVISLFPTQSTVAHYGEMSFRPSTPGAYQQAGLYIEGSTELASNQNNNGTGSHQAIIRNMSGQGNGPYTDSSGVAHPPSGPAQLVRLRHCGGCYLDDVTHLGYGLAPSPYASCTLSVGNVVAVHCKRVNSNYCEASIKAQGYLEHPILEDCSTAPSGSVYDGMEGSVLSGGTVACLIAEVRGGDIDCFYFGYRFVLATSVTFNGTEVQSPDGPTVMSYGQNTSAIIELYGCSGGTLVGLNGGSDGTGYDMIQLNDMDLDGRIVGTSGLVLGMLIGGGFATTVRTQPGSNNNFFDDRTILLNGSATGAIVDAGTNNYATPPRATCYSAAATLTTTSSAIPLTGYLDKRGLFAAGNGSATIKVAGTYQVNGYMPAADAGATGAPTAGAQIGLQVNGSVMGAGPLQWTTAGAAHTTAQYTGTFAFAAGEVVSLNGQTSSGSAAMSAAHFTLLCIDLA
jgi:hypothetical protein